jgi:hypothetical protein
MAMVDRVSFHAAQRRGAARFSAACLLATLTLVAAAPFVSAQTNTCGGDNGGITLPSGFCATIFADDLGHARQMAFGPNGVLYLNTWSGGYYQNDKPPDGGFLVALKDTKGNGRADVMARFGDGVAQDSAGGTGIRIYNGGLFAEQNDKIIRRLKKCARHRWVTRTSDSPSQRVEEISRSGDSVGLAGGDDIEFACGSHIWASEDWRGYKALAGSGMINGKSLR